MSEEDVARMLESVFNEVAKCPHATFDQLGMLVCMKNPDDPGECTPAVCPYGMREKEG